MLENISSYLKNEDYRVSILKNKIHVLNYKSIIDINEKEAFLKLEDKIIKIYGSDLKLVKLDKNELLLSGKVEKVLINV